VLILFWQKLRYLTVSVIDFGRPAGQLDWMRTLLMWNHHVLNHENQQSYLNLEMPGEKKKSVLWGAIETTFNFAQLD